MVYKNLPEQFLLKRCSDNDAAAFCEIYERYKEFVYVVVKGRLEEAEEARDITQDIFLNLWINRSQLESIREFKVYLYVVCRNQVVSAYRKKNVRIKGEIDLIERIDALEHSAEDRHYGLELNKHVGQVVDQMPETMRNCYQLSKNEGKKNTEIAGILNISEKTVRNNVSEALKRLKVSLQNSHPELLLILILSCYLTLHFFIALL
jgi:RNA polymerase sigma-70 factor (ECF subfamily)